MARVKIDQVKVKNRLFRAEVDTATGRFHAKVGEVEVEGETVEKLKVKVREALKTSKVVVAVPFYSVEANKLVRGVATGLHAGNGNVVVAWDNGQKTQVPRYERMTAVADLSEEEVKELEETLEARNAAQKKLQELIEKRKFDLHRRVREEVEKAGDKEDADEETSPVETGGEG